MRKSRFFAAVSLMLVSTTIFAASVTPKQLKEARKSVYEWVDNYKYHSMFTDGEHSQDEYYNLFESPESEVFNDFLPNQAATTAVDYSTTIVQSEHTFRVSTNNVHVERESINNGVYQCELSMERTVSCRLKGDDSYFYPEKKYAARIKLSYSFAEKRIVCESITSNDDIHVESILHTDSTNEYINYSDTAALLQSSEICLINRRLKYAAADEHFVSIAKDTLKNNIHFGGQVGLTLFSAGNIGNDFSQFAAQMGLVGGATFGYYRQISLRDRKRWGVEISARFAQQNVSFTGEYHDSYISVDPDGGGYLRKTDITNYKETIKRSVVEIPIAVRFDCFVPSRKDLSVYGKLGVCLGYDVIQKTSCQADAQYSGYYDWLFDVTISQNGVYNFGQFELAQTANRSSIKQLGYGGLVALGVQWFPTPKISIEGGLEYCAMYHSILNDDDFKVSSDYEHWNSATGLFKYFLSHSIALQMTLNYNF